MSRYRPRDIREGETTSHPLDGDLTKPLSKTKKKERAEKRKSIREKYLELTSDQYWRLNHLYKIVDRNSNTIPFVMNEVQEDLYANMWYWNIILKARQLGFSQFISILGLDYALFNDNMSVEIIAHTLNDAIKIFDKKVKFVYDNLPDEVKEACSTVKANVRQLKFNNNSVISVGTSARSDVISFLHISEYSNICAMRPDRAREIITGSLPAVHTGSLVFIESTARGAIGDFYNKCKESEDRLLQNATLNKRQFKFHFYPWHKSSGNRLDPQTVTVYPWQVDYFKDLELKHKIGLDEEQKAWYGNECLLYKDDMKRENPSYSEESFFESTEGAYYITQFRKIREENRIGKVPHIPGYSVDTWWDIGVGDSTAIWFTQTVGRELHWINYYENSGEGLEHYINILKDYEKKFNYIYGRHGAPHDINVREFGNNAVSRLESAARLGIRFEVCPNLPIDEGIEAVRQTLGVSWFDEEKCEMGIRLLESYRKEWDIKHGRWKDKPRHDECSHPADSARLCALMWKQPMYRGKTIIKHKPAPVAGAWT